MRCTRVTVARRIIKGTTETVSAQRARANPAAPPQEESPWLLDTAAVTTDQSSDRTWACRTSAARVISRFVEGGAYPETVLSAAALPH